MDASKHSSFSAYVSGVTGTRFAGTSPARNGHRLAYYIDVAFRNYDAFQQAIKKPFVQDNQPVLFDYAVGASLAGVVELRIDLRDLNTPDRDIIKAVQAALEPANIGLLAIAKVYNTKASKFGPIPLFQGGIVVYAQVKQIKQDQQGLYRAKLTEVLPGAVTINSTTLPLRHAFEGQYCPRCRFAGHSSDECPRYPCASCFQPGHVASACTNPTGKKLNGAKAVQHTIQQPALVVGSQGWTAARSGYKPATSTNTTPLGSRSRYDALNIEESSDSSANTAQRHQSVAPHSGPTKAERRAESRERRIAAKDQQPAPNTPDTPRKVIEADPVTPRVVRPASSVTGSDAHNDKRARAASPTPNIKIRGTAPGSQSVSLPGSSAASAGLAPVAYGEEEDVTMEHEPAYLTDTQTEPGDGNDEQEMADSASPSPATAASPASASQASTASA